MRCWKTGHRGTIDRGSGRCMTGAIVNLPALPCNPLMNVLFRVNRNVPSLLLNNTAPLFIIENRKTVRR